MPQNSTTSTAVSGVIDDLRVDLDFNSIGAFVAGFGPNLSRAGLFLPTTQLERPSTRVRLIVALRNGATVIEGTAVVLWARGPARSNEPPRTPGMGLLFDELDAESRQLVDYIVSKNPPGDDSEPPDPDRLGVSPVAASVQVKGKSGGESKAALPHVAPIIQPLSVTPAPKGKTPVPQKREARTPAPRTPAPDASGVHAPARVATASPAQTPAPRAPASLTSPPFAPYVAAPRSAPASENAEASTPLGSVSVPQMTERSAELRPEAHSAVKASGAVASLRLVPDSADDDLSFALGETDSAETSAAPDNSSIDFAFDANDFAGFMSPPSQGSSAKPRLQAEAAANFVPTSDVAASSTPLGKTSSARSGSAIEALRLSRALESARRGESSKAETELLAAVGQDPGNARYRLELGLVYFEWSSEGEDHDSSAEACFQRAAELDTTMEAPFIHLGDVQRRRGNLVAAERSYRKALERNPHSRGALEGVSLLSALKSRSRMWAVVSVSAVAILLVVVGAIVGKSANADADADAAPTAVATPQATPPLVVTTQAPPPVVPVVSPPVAVAVVPAPQVVEAPPAPTPVQVVAEIRPPPPAVKVATKPDAKSGDESTQVQARDGEAARRTAQSSPPPAPRANRPAALVKKGDAALRSGKVEEALQAYREALVADPSHAAAHRGLGSVYVMQGRDSEAAAAYKKYLAIAPSAPDAARIRGLIEGL